MPPEPVKGLKELDRKLRELGAGLGGKTLRSATLQATLPAFNEAKARIPVNDRDYLKKTYKGRPVAPGFAKRNIARKSRLSSDKRTATAMIGVKPEAFYAVAFVEKGTSKMRRRPWLEPSFRRNRAAMVTRLGDRLRAKIDKIRRGP